MLRDIQSAKKWRGDIYIWFIRCRRNTLRIRNACCVSNRFDRHGRMPIAAFSIVRLRCLSKYDEWGGVKGRDFNYNGLMPRALIQADWFDWLLSVHKATYMNGTGYLYLCYVPYICVNETLCPLQTAEALTAQKGQTNNNNNCLAVQLQVWKLETKNTKQKRERKLFYWNCAPASKWKCDSFCIFMYAHAHILYNY